MKVAVVGCGAVGSYYGAHLCRAGEEVHFLLRSDYHAVRRNGVFIQSPAGDFNVRPKTAASPEDIGPSDLVIIGLKATANHRFPELLPPLVGSHTAVLTLQNGLGNEEALAKLFPVEQILGGLCFVCLNRIAPGVIRHMDHGMVVLGEYERWPEPRTHDIASLFRKSGIPCKVAPNLARAHWEKLVWNIPFNGLGVASAAGYERVSGGTGTLPECPGECLTTDRLLGDPRWETLVREVMIEVITAARALGCDIPESLADRQIERTRTMGAYKPSTLVDFERGHPLELEALFLEPLRRAEQAGARVPRLKTLCSVLEQLSRRPERAMQSAEPGTEGVK
ncbi:MAG TPA: 2-dehydropantoate 2-reductase [Verrucomicrobia bacterium]|nr:2-dehydropantoate 2-reductase [Verrucomicrobiota bacterium]HOB32501.1 2-dehydropantoate 2-reductase [Verrucomicrobiota bacterium]HOP96675.1 2-dehydropantoate 2-reductase [Verrucomicrobiota bacterium]HPU55779.1 2-dehydropantoate 2-reductase [Verrucomicrobiota bacterium]